jgi:hypothetical protein
MTIALQEIEFHCRDNFQISQESYIRHQPLRFKQFSGSHAARSCDCDSLCVP